jgi:PAS domain S-box-containing protein
LEPTEPGYILDEEGRYRLLVESIQDYAIFMLDPAGRIVTWNVGAERICGYPAGEIVGQHFSRFYPRDAVDRKHPEHELRVAAEQGRYEEDGWRVRRDGTVFWANVVLTALRDASGTLRGFGTVTRDLSNRRDQEEALRQSEERFRLLVENVKDYAIFMLDPNGNIATWNTGAERIKGYGAEEIIGRHFSVFYPKDAVESGWPQHELEIATTTGRYEEEGWRIKKDGTRFWAHVTITALRDDDGRLRGFAKLTRDLTEHKRAESAKAHGDQQDAMLEAERAARIEAQRAVRMKDEFLATLSHELRSPLNAIVGWAQVLRMSRVASEPEVTQPLDVIERNAKAQVQLIDELLDLSRILAGQMRLDLQRVALTDVITGAVESAQPTADAKGVRLETIVDARRGVVSGDPGRLQQVVWNLLSNAIKFTPRGGKVQVLLERVNSHVELTVSDTGIGIPVDFLPHVFQRFSQRDSGVARRHGGLGLGLAISRQLVELHGGSISAKSAGEGRGASFIVRLPLALLRDGTSDTSETAAELVADDALALPELNGARVLVVDDEPDARELVRHLPEKHGARVSTAGSAGEALSMLAMEAPDVLLSDVGMPGTDGYQLMRTIRSREARGQHLPSLALTAFARAEDRKRAMLAGYDVHLAKPFDSAELLLMLASLVNRH